MSADLDQFGRDNTHCAIIGGKSLVQLRHQPTDGRRSFYQVNIVSGIGSVQSRLHAGNAATDNHHSANSISRHLFSYFKKDSIVLMSSMFI